ncbi:MAG TPA: amidohydrolase family protein [Planctomycetota bacterium]
MSPVSRETFWRLLAGAVFLLFAAVAGWAQEPPPGPDPQPEPAVEAAEEIEEVAEAAAEPEVVENLLAIVGGRIHTVTDGVIHQGTVLVRAGRIEAVGAQVSVPAGARVIDATGMHVYPGLVATDASGLLGRPPKPADSFDPFSLTVDLALSGGLTTVHNNGVVGKLTRGTLEGHILRENPFVELSYSSTSPTSRRKLVEDLEKAREFLRQRHAAERARADGDKDAKDPSDKGVNKDLVELLEGRRTAQLQGSNARDLLAVVDLLERFPMRAVVGSGIEAWTVAPQLGRAGVMVVVSPRQKNWADDRFNRPNGWSIENARILHDAGVRFTLQPRSSSISTGGIAGRDLLTLPMEAAFAIRGGLPQAAALKAITLDAARILGVEDRIGSIEAGKDADLIVTDGDLFDYRTFVQWAVVNGRVAYDKQAAPYFAHIRPRQEPPSGDALDALRAAAPGGADAALDDGKDVAEPRDVDAPENSSGTNGG